MWNPVHPPDPEHTTEPPLGWRAWRLHRTDAGLRIAPTTPRSDWPPREAIHARCSGAHTRLYLVFNPELEPAHRSPMPGCTCGIHAVKDPRRLARGANHAGVIGRVAMWGRVIEHSKGWRAEFAYPSRMRLICAWCLPRHRLPGVPSRVFSFGEWLRPACEPHAARAADHPSLPLAGIEAELLDGYGVEILPQEALVGAGG